MGVESGMKSEAKVSGLINGHYQAFIKRGLCDAGPDDIVAPATGQGYERVSTAVSAAGASLSADVLWENRSTDFFHTERVGELWAYDYPLKLHHRAVGAWDRRTPILHPAVAAVDATQAGYDDAYLRAMANADILVGVQREDSKLAMRRLVEKYSKLHYHPFRVLVRGVVLWALASRNEMRCGDKTEYRVQGLKQPLRLDELGGYSVMAKAQVNSMSDVLYVRAETASELYMVEVMRALCNATCPVKTAATVKLLWPPLNDPYVVYTAPSRVELGLGEFDAAQVESTLSRFCDIFDCHDLLGEAFRLVQFFLVRPDNAGVLAGSNNLALSLPPSDMRVGAIGPLLAGISAEGMKTVPFIFPDFSEYVYSGAVRGCFISAAYFEALRSYDDTHPVAIHRSAAVRAGKYKLLCRAGTAMAFMRDVVGPLVARAGWACMSESLYWVCPVDSNHLARKLLNAARVPWWTNVIGHLSDEGKQFLSTWASPAGLSDTPVPNQWYTYNGLGGVTNAQLVAAARWTGATIAYCVDDTLSPRRWEAIALGTINRFMPDLRPTVKLGQEVVAVACVKFPDGVHGAMARIRSLQRSVVGVVRYNENELSVEHGDVSLAFEGAQAPTQAHTIQLSENVSVEDVPAAEADTPSVQDDINWGKVATDLNRGGLDIRPHVLTSALRAPIDVSSIYAQAAGMLAVYNPLEAISAVADKELKQDMLRAYMLAAGRLGPHAPRLVVNESIGTRTREAVAALSLLTGTNKTPVNWADEVEAAAAAKAAFDANRGVPAARDDPDGSTETPEDFGSGTSGRDSSGVPTIAPSVSNLSHMGKIGFVAPPSSAA